MSPTTSQASLALDTLTSLSNINSTVPGNVPKAAWDTIAACLLTPGWTGVGEAGGTPYGTPPTAIDRDAQIAVRVVSVLVAEFAATPTKVLTADGLNGILADAASAH